MKKIFTLMILASGFALGAQAQKDGFYHVQNTLTGRYMVMVDNSQGTTSGAGNIDMESVETCLDLDEINTHAGSVIYIKGLGGTKYDVQAQGTSISKLSGNKLNAQIKAEGDGYVIWGAYSGVTVYLGDATNLKKGSDTEYKTWSYVKEAGKNNRYWKLCSIDNKEHFIGIDPDCKDGKGNYWGTMYFGFAFKTYSEGMEVYYVDGVGDKHFSLKKWTKDVVPATMPVVIKCSSSNPKNNIIKPVTDDESEPKDNCLYGRFFDNSNTGHVNRLEYNSKTMRVINVEDGELVFTVADKDYLTDGKYVPHNKAYLEVKKSASTTLTNGDPSSAIQTVKQETETIDDGIYTLEGVRMPKGVTPRPGIYIQDGKKVVIK